MPCCSERQWLTSWKSTASCGRVHMRTPKQRAIRAKPASRDLRGVATLNGDSLIDNAAFAGAEDRTLLIDHLEVADRYFAESEHRIARQQSLISKLRAKRRTTLVAVEFLQLLQDSRLMHGKGRNRLQRALATLDERLGTLQAAV